MLARILSFMMCAILLAPSSALAQAGRFQVRNVPAPPHVSPHVPIHIPGLGEGAGAILWIVVAVIVVGVIGFAGWSAGQAFAMRSRGQAVRPSECAPIPDLIRGPAEVAGKALQTARLLKFLAAKDQTLDPTRLSTAVQSLFEGVQHCWQQRDYSSIKDQLTPVLLAEHQELINAMMAERLVNRIDNLSIQRVEFVHFVSQPHDHLELTALITFNAKITFVNDRTETFVRGTLDERLYQEFWTLERSDGAWRLLRIVQCAEGGQLLLAPNRVAGLSAQELEDVERPAYPSGKAN